MSQAVSIHIGVSRPGGLYDARALLADSEIAAWRMAQLANEAGYRSMLVLRGPTATLGAVNAALWNVSQMLVEGDKLLVTFSGHGGQVPDRDDEEPYGSDESWSLYDGELLDDTLAGYWRLFKRGVRIVVVSESCYSGGMSRGSGEHEPDPLDSYPGRRMTRLRRRFRGSEAEVQAAVADVTRSCIASPPLDACEISASVLMLTAAAEHQTAQAGLFTETLLNVWAGGTFPGNYCQLYEQVRRRVMGINMNQEPQILMLGLPDARFPLLPAFRVTPAEEPQPQRVYRDAGRRGVSRGGW